MNSFFEMFNRLSAYVRTKKKKKRNGKMSLEWINKYSELFIRTQIRF